MYKLTYIVLIILMSSCYSIKDVFKSKKETDKVTTELVKTTVKRKKDSVILIPSYIYKDTTIYRRGKTTTLRTTYNSKGRISEIDCISDEFDEVRETQRQILETIKEEKKEVHKEGLFKEIYILYLFLGFAFLIIVSKLGNKLA